MAAGPTYYPLATNTLTGNAASYTFTAIPSTYTDLILVVTGQVSSNVTIACQINGDTSTNYSVTELYGVWPSSGSSGYGSARVSNNAQISIASIVAQVDSGHQWTSMLHFNNYANTTTYKSVLGRTSAGATGVNAIGGLWRSTSAISSIKIMGYANASGFTSGTTFTIYGIQAA